MVGLPEELYLEAERIVRTGKLVILQHLNSLKIPLEEDLKNWLNVLKTSANNIYHAGYSVGIIFLIIASTLSLTIPFSTS